MLHALNQRPPPTPRTTVDSLVDTVDRSPILLSLVSFLPSFLPKLPEAHQQALSSLYPHFCWLLVLLHAFHFSTRNYHRSMYRTLRICAHNLPIDLFRFRQHVSKSGVAVTATASATASATISLHTNSNAGNTSKPHLTKKTVGPPTQMLTRIIVMTMSKEISRQWGRTVGGGNDKILCGRGGGNVRSMLPSNSQSFIHSLTHLLTCSLILSFLFVSTIIRATI